MREMGRGGGLSPIKRNAKRTAATRFANRTVDNSKSRMDTSGDDAGPNTAI